MTYRSRMLIVSSIGLAATAGIGLYAYFGVYVHGREEHLAQSISRLVLGDFDKQRVVRIELERKDELAVLVRAGVDSHQLPAWRMEKPVESDADGLEINSLLGVLAGLESRRSLPAADPGSLDRYGLAPPRVLWRLRFEDGSGAELRVGKVNPFDRSLYLQPGAGREILVAEGYLDRALDKRVFDLRQKRLLVVEPAHVDELVLKKRSTRIALRRHAVGWQIVEPVQDRADDDRVRSILQLLRNLQALRFIDRPASLAGYGLDSPALELHVRTGESWQRVALAEGSLEVNRDKAFARVLPDGATIEVRRHVVGSLDRSLFDLQAKAPLVFERSAVYRIKSTTRDGLLVLERSDPPEGAAGETPSWSLVSPRPAGAKAYRVHAFLTALAGLRAVRFCGDKGTGELSRFGLAPPARSISLFDKNGQSLGELRLGGQETEGVHAVGSSRPQICLLPLAAIRRLPLDPDSFLDEPAGPHRVREKP
ncbi:MAG: DUF4340 domain-containing protein [Deltaproteobacteria bacterium]|nr:DUF4340 domain-containing protein [Deltaproteobacteria bacterium]